MRKPNGFTLLELSVVVLIIGLIVGGLMVGRDLIRMSRIRADISALDNYEQAVANFSTKYSCMPGDCANISRIFSGEHNGNGDRLIDGAANTAPETAFDSAYIGYEIAHANAHLARAGIVNIKMFDSNSTTHIDEKLPTLSENVLFMLRMECIQNGASCLRTGKHTYRLGVSPIANNPGHVQTLPAPYTAHEAFTFDSKIDDGRATTGSVTVGASNATTPFMPVSAFWDGTTCSIGANKGLNQTTCEYDGADDEMKIGLFVRSSAF